MIFAEMTPPLKMGSKTYQCTKGGKHKANKEVFPWNIETGSWKSFRHPPTSKVHLQLQPFSSKMSYQKKDTKPKGTLKTLMSSKGKQKPWKGVKPTNKLKGIKAMHLQGYLAKPINTNWEVEWSKARGTRETRLRMWVSFTNKGKRHEGKTTKKVCKAWKWTRTKRGWMNGSPWHIPIDERIIDNSPLRKWWVKNKGNF